MQPHPEKNRVKSMLYHLLFDSKAYIPNFRLLGPYNTTIPGGGGVGAVKTRYKAKTQFSYTANWN